VQHVKRGEAAEGFYASMSWIIFISLIFVTILSGQGMLGEVFEVNSQYILYLLGAYTVAMIFFVGRESASIGGKFAKGLFDLFFGVIGYVSDMLSYTRLVALGLATGIIAAVVNTLAELAGGGLVNAGGWKFIVGYLVMGVIFVGGHIFNIALNVLGSYITVGRLHFVEFFNKFFESGGEELHLFQPVQESTRIVIQ
jgi:V/A-type H+-transporting ATPase subunit I